LVQTPFQNPMPTPPEILGHLTSRQVLDLATGSGNFIHFLLEGLPPGAQILGVDANPRAAQAFAAAFVDQPNVQFQVGDALNLGFAADTFDLVCLSNSLHHFADPQPVLRQMDRVLRPGGTLLVAEMYCDGQTAAQQTHVELHHWWAAIDHLHGILHRETYPRQALIDLLTGLGLEALTLHDLAETESDPFAPEIRAELEPVFERYLQRAEGQPELQARGAALRERVETVGFQSATTLLALGVKPHPQGD
jgi:SAM-dependent methyltransferase